VKAKYVNISRKQPKTNDNKNDNNWLASYVVAYCSRCWSVSVLE